MNFSKSTQLNQRCVLCPRECRADRKNGQKGFCGATSEKISIARASLHMWEEECISGKEGSGTVFFSGCTLRCAFCQNYDIARSMIGKEITVDRLADIFIELQDKNANNINLVTPTHYTMEIIEAVSIARKQGLTIPIVYNCSGYEKVETLKLLENIVDIYLTDFKYMDSEIANTYSQAKDYPKIAKMALAEMVRQKCTPQFDDRHMMTSGVIVRHLILPGHTRDSKSIIKYIRDNYKDNVLLSLMNQYTPLDRMKDDKNLGRRLTRREYNKVVDYAIELGIENGFFQEGKTAKESFIPAFDFEDVIKNE